MGDETKAPLQLAFDPREQGQIDHARHYAEHFAYAGAPGHGQFLLIAKISALLEDAVSRFGYAPDRSPPVKVQQLAFDKDAGCWRDLVTGVKVEVR